MADIDEIIAHHAAGTLPQLFVERIRRHRSDDIGKAFRETLVSLHNDETIDVLDAARGIGESPIGQSDFFFVQSVFVDLIPELKAEVPAMLAAVKALVARAGNDGAAGMPNGAFRSWAEAGGRASGTLTAINPDDPEDAAYVFLGLQALAKSDAEGALARAIDYLAGSSPPAQSAAAKAIGTLPLANAEARTRAADALASAHASGADDNLLGHVLTAICEIARAVPEMEPAAIALIEAAAPKVGEQAVHQVSLELMFHAEDLPPPILAALAGIAQKVRVENLATLKNLDYAASGLLRHGRVDEALALLAPLISAHDELVSLERFDSFAHGLLGLNADALARVIVAWLLALDSNLGEAARALVGDHHGTGPLILDLDAGSLGLSDADTILLAHRAIGYLFIHPITAASLVLALIPNAGAEPRRVMADILFDPLLLNYSGELTEWLESKRADVGDPVRSVIDGLLSRLEAYLDGVRKAGRIKELRPSERERLIENHRQQESMRQAHKLAEKKSILMSIVSRSVLLYGNRSISYFEGFDGKKHRNEMKLHSMSHSFEAPRIDILEPFDLDYTLRVFRAMRLAQ